MLSKMRRIKPLMLALLALNLALIAVALQALYFSRLQFHQQAQTTAQNLTAVLEESLEGKLDKIDMALQTLRDRVERAQQSVKAERIDLNAFALALRARVPELTALRMVDQTGQLIYGADAKLLQRVNYSEREFFRHWRDQPGRELFFDKPLHGKTSGDWLLNLSRRVDHPDGSFAGVVFAPMRLSQIEALFNLVDDGPGGTISLHDAQLQLIARSHVAPAADSLGTPQLEPAWQQALAANRQKGSYHSGTQSFDGQERNHSYRRLDRYPGYLNVGLSPQDYLANWRKQAGLSAVFLALFALASAALLWRLNANLLELQERSRRLNEAEQLASSGSWELDHASGQVVGSEQLTRIFELTPACLTLTDVRLLQRIHRHDRRRVKVAFWRAIQSGANCVLRYRLAWPDGRIKYLHQEQRTRLDASGKPRWSLGTVQDVTQRDRSSARDAMMLRLSGRSDQLSEQALLDEGLQMLETLTGSQIGFLYLVNDDQETPLLVNWSAGALQVCRAACDTHDPISQAGIWADCLRQRAPMIFNDYASTPAKHALPQGHAPLHRLICVPIIEEGKVRMLLAVGNKALDYDDFDSESAQLLGGEIWRMARRAMAERDLSSRLVELAQLNARLTQAHSQLLQSDKMASVGQLAAGVAHEINNPMAFIQSNLGTLERYVQSLLELLQSAQDHSRQCADANWCAAFAALAQAHDIDFLRQDIAALISESRDGAARIRRIVQNLRAFSHSNTDEWVWADLHAGLESTLNLVWHSIKHKAEVIKRWADLPPVCCLPAQLNQVFMNLLINAEQAISEHGQITIATGVLSAAAPSANVEQPIDGVWISISDNGGGISEADQRRIFEPFFTAKPVGEGTGLGLSLSWAIVQKHHGTLTVESRVGVGTTFRITLPLNGQLEGLHATSDHA